jgi:4-hydroxybenzoate polyprenyltransferase
MYKEFFIGHWLRNDRFVYALTHTPIMPLMGLYAYSLYLFRSGLELKYSVGFYLAICFFVGLAFEIARKVSAPEEERDETETYSKYFGTKGVVIVLVLLLLAITVCALLLGWFAHLTLYFFCGAILFFFFTVLGLWRFAHAPTPQNATRIGLYTSLYVLAIFLLMVFETLFTRGIAFG